MTVADFHGTGIVLVTKILLTDSVTTTKKELPPNLMTGRQDQLRTQFGGSKKFKNFRRRRGCWFWSRRYCIGWQGTWVKVNEWAIQNAGICTANQLPNAFLAQQSDVVPNSFIVGIDQKLICEGWVQAFHFLFDQNLGVSQRLTHLRALYGGDTVLPSLQNAVIIGQHKSKTVFSDFVNRYSVEG